MLEKYGIQYVDSYLRNYENISPQEVVDYYTSLGDWQEVLTKTDYAYSPVSIYHKKKINGIYPVIPNMSRPSLWKYEFGEDAPEIDYYINKVVEKHLMHLRSTSEHVSEWTSAKKRSFFPQSSTLTHFLLISLFIFFVLFSLKKLSFS